ncbi:MAG: hypothetical protein PHX61_12760 [Alphaproteobacteria bacterium]|nr:hypothetical protein [Alphaproteobacteria bacterium]
MDEKTLEYMGARVDKARKLTKDIATLNSYISSLENDNTKGVCFVGNYQEGYVKLGDYYDSKLTIPVIPETITAAISALVVRRDTLQAELDAI